MSTPEHIPTKAPTREIVGVLILSKEETRGCCRSRSRERLFAMKHQMLLGADKDKTRSAGRALETSYLIRCRGGQQDWLHGMMRCCKR